MSDREAFVQAIAANPTDDLPRLVFADWLEEHGEPERAEFIRTQIRWHHADADERKQLDLRAGELFREHWQRWFGPFLTALGPSADLPRCYSVRDDLSSLEGGSRDVGHAASRVALAPRPDKRGSDTSPVTCVSVHRGFASTLTVEVDQWEGQGSLATAFQYEPPPRLVFVNGLHSPQWQRFTDPCLRRVEHVTMSQRWAWDVSAPESTAFLEDPHLAGVRSFSVWAVNHRTPRVYNDLPIAWLERFVRSSLAYRLTGLCLYCINADGVRPLCRPGRLHLERLELAGSMTADMMRRLVGSDLVNTVRVLKVQSAEPGNSGAATLAQNDWRKLTHLQLPNCGLTAAVLPALASATFIPQLKELDLSGNPLFTGDDRDTARLERLAEVLDPNRLERLNLTDTGLSHVPGFLAERFGDRVKV